MELMAWHAGKKIQIASRAFSIRLDDHGIGLDAMIIGIVTRLTEMTVELRRSMARQCTYQPASSEQHIVTNMANCSLSESAISQRNQLSECK